MKKPELLVPASSLEVLKTAVRYGADAVYIGGEVFGLRAKAKNFSLEEMIEGVEYAHNYNVRVHVTVNILAHNDDIEQVRLYLIDLKKVKPDALIIADPAIFTMAKEIIPEAEIHISTQANNTNYGTYKFWHDLGAKRVVSARELSLREIKEIREKIPEDMEIESFVHGAMCISYSGRCLLSSFMAGRDANKGACTHPCRWKYAVVEESRPGQYMPVYENKRGTYIFNSKDLCMIEHIPELVDAGIDSFKIEGRMKTALYVATVARTYRMAIDDYFESPELYNANLEKYKTLISQCTYRQYTTGFFFGKPDEETQIYDQNVYERDYVYLGIVGDVKTPEKLVLLGELKYSGELESLEELKASEELKYSGELKASEELKTQGELGARNEFWLEQKNKFSVGASIEIMKSHGEDIPVTVISIKDEDGTEMESCPHPKQKLLVKLSQNPAKGDILRMKED